MQSSSNKEEAKVFLLFLLLFCFYNNSVKSFLVVQNFRKAVKIGFISFDLSSLEKGC